MFLYWGGEGQGGWAVMSGVLLCITGVEAMYADLGHFSRPAVQVLGGLASQMLLPKL
jgi:KUP system potassium uptake protein